jgi:hypothetical protein
MEKPPRFSGAFLFRVSRSGFRGHWTGKGKALRKGFLQQHGAAGELLCLLKHRKPNFKTSTGDCARRNRVNVRRWRRSSFSERSGFGRLTRTQASAICNVPLPLVNQEVNGKKKPAPKPSHASGVCLTWWRQAPFSDRVYFVRACGVSEVWDALSTAIV